MGGSTLEAILRRDRTIIIAALASCDILRADLAWLSDDMAMTGYRLIPAGQGLMMPASSAWQPVEFAYVFVVWVVMMIGVMLPSATPIILLHAAPPAKERRGAAAIALAAAWALMLLLFVLGVMNLLWIAALAILVMLEKVLPFGRAVARLAGLFFVALGGWMLLLT
jgi:predicted metal-binding membrane protein